MVNVVAKTTNRKRAREIMGRNFFGIEEAIKYFKITPTEQELVTFTEIPFTKARLKKLKDTHILIAIFPLSIKRIRKTVEQGLFFSYEDSWYNNELFATMDGTARWHLVRKTELPNSVLKNYFQQQTILSKNESVPTARVMTYTAIGHFLATDEILFKNPMIRTSSQATSQHNSLVCIGFSEEGRLTISSGCSDTAPLPNIGLASERKPEGLSAYFSTYSTYRY